jgi:transcriptional antiterminator Rof (Rho-off)
MRQYDVCHLTRREQLIVVLQHDVTDELATRIVAPLVKSASHSNVARIRVPVAVNGGKYLLCLDRMAAVDRSEIGNVVDSIADADFPTKNGLDFLFFGV